MSVDASSGPAEETTAPADPEDGPGSDSAGSGGGRSVEDTLRRAALIAIAVIATIAVVVLVAVKVLGDGGTFGSSADDAPADVSAPAQTPFDELPDVQVQTPSVTPEADAACPALMSSLPAELAGEQSRRVASESPYAYAWGDPAVVLVCGTPQAAYLKSSFVVGINQVAWIVDLTDPDVNVYDTVDRSVPIQVRIPSSQDSATVTALGPLIAAAVPAVQLTPQD